MNHKTDLPAGKKLAITCAIAALPMLKEAARDLGCHIEDINLVSLSAWVETQTPTV